LSTPGKTVFGDRKQHVDRLELREHGDACGVASGNVVALIDLTQTEAAADRCGDVAIVDIEFCGGDQALIGFDRAFVLVHERGLRVDLLLGNRELRRQSRVALEILLRIREQA